MVTLTFRSREHEAAFGTARDFWRKVRQTWLGTRYFCWLELHRDGQFHYHAIWINPPSVRRVDLVSWIDHHWTHGRTQVRFRQVSRGDDGLMDYVLKYTSKTRGKRYQQAYDEVPSQLRTFMSQRFDVPRDELLEHTEHELWRYDGGTVYLGELRAGHLVLYADHRHAEPSGPSTCELAGRHRPRGPGRPRARGDLEPIGARARARRQLQHASPRRRETPR